MRADPQNVATVAANTETDPRGLSVAAADKFEEGQKEFANGFFEKAGNRFHESASLAKAAIDRDLFVRATIREGTCRANSQKPISVLTLYDLAMAYTYPISAVRAFCLAMKAQVLIHQLAKCEDGQSCIDEAERILRSDQLEAGPQWLKPEWTLRVLKALKLHYIPMTSGDYPLARAGASQLLREAGTDSQAQSVYQYGHTLAAYAESDQSSQWEQLQVGTQRASDAMNLLDNPTLSNQRFTEMQLGVIWGRMLRVKRQNPGFSELSPECRQILELADMEFDVIVNSRHVAEAQRTEALLLQMHIAQRLSARDREALLRRELAKRLADPDTRELIGRRDIAARHHWDSPLVPLRERDEKAIFWLNNACKPVAKKGRGRMPSKLVGAAATVLLTLTLIAGGIYLHSKTESRFDVRPETQIAVVIIMDSPG